MTHTLAVRLDSVGDVLVTGPAVRALAARSQRLTVWCGPVGRPAAELLPGVDEVLCCSVPWIDADPGPVDPDVLDALRADLRARHIDRAAVFTSFHQSPLPTALVLRLAGVPWVGAISEDYPGSLLDLRHLVPDDLPEPERALSLARACGAELPVGDDGRLAVRLPEASGSAPVLEPPYVVLHPGTSVPARAWPAAHFRDLCLELARDGRRVAVTGAVSERPLTRYVSAGAPDVVDVGGRTDLASMARLLADADAVVVGNTGPAHLAAAVGTPVVSLFAPTVPAVRWAPYGVPVVVLGDQRAECRDTRASRCPVPGHPCLTSVTVADVLDAVDALTSGSRDHGLTAGRNAR